MSCRCTRGLLIGFVVFLLSFGVSLEPLEAQSCIVTTPIGTEDDYAKALVIQPDGKIVVAGSSYSGDSDIAVLRYHADGTLDTGFDSDGITLLDYSGGNDDWSRDVLLQPDGKIVIGGHVVFGNDEFTVARYKTDGSLDSPAFGGDGVVTTDIYSSWDLGYEAAIQSDGKIVLAGSVHDGSQYDVAVVRYTSDGTEDAAFGGGDGIVTLVIGSGDDYTNSMVLQPDGKILVNGFFDNGSDHDCFVVRFDTDGNLDNSFGTSGIATLDMSGSNNYCDGLSLQSDGKIVLAGHYDNGPDQDIVVARMDSDGSLDGSFSSSGIVTTRVSGANDNTNSVTVQSDGKIVLTGFTGTFGNEDILVIRYHADGSLDTSFDSDGIVTTAIGSTAEKGADVAIQPDGKIVVVGESHNGANLDVALVRYNSDGSVDESCGKRYRSVGTSAADLNTSSRTVEIYGTTATFSGPMPDNVGVGDVLQYGSTYLAFIHGRLSDRVYTVAPANGGTPQAAAAGTSVSVYRAYTSLFNWEAQNENDTLDDTVENFDTSTDLVSNETVMMVACYGDGADTTDVIINGWITGPSNYIKIYTPYETSEVGTSQRHNGVWDTNAYRLEFPDEVLRVSDNYVRIDGLQVRLTASVVDVSAVLYVGTAGTAYYELSNSVIRGNGDTVDDIRFGVNLYNSGSGVLKIWNNIIYDWLGGSGLVAGIAPDDPGFTFYIYNNTIVDCEDGIAVWAGTVIAKNNLVFNNVDNYSGSFDASSTNNLSNLAQPDAPGTNQRHVASVAFVNEAGDDFHLASSDTGARNYGTDLSADASLAFADDIDRESRAGSWDIGADEDASIPLYRSVGVTATALESGGTNAMTISGSAATFDSGLADNIGVGDVIQYDSDGNDTIDALAFIHGRTDSQTYTVKDKDGATPTAVIGDNNWAIYRAYTSLRFWQSQNENSNILEPTEDDVNPPKDLVSANSVMMVACYDDGTDSTGFTITGWTTNADNYIKIYTPTSTNQVGVTQRHDGTAGTGYRIDPGLTIFRIEDSYVQIEGLEVYDMGGSGSYINGIELITASPTSVSISHCLIHSEVSNNHGKAIYANGWTQGGYHKIFNNIIYDIEDGIALDIANPVYVYNNTVVNTVNGIWGYSEAVLKNNISYNNTDNYWGTLHASSTNNLSGPSQTDAPGSNPRNAVTVTFINAAGSNFHLDSSDTGAMDQGVNLSSDSNLAFTGDIDGGLRGAQWDIGADEQGSSANALTLSDHTTGQAVDKFGTAPSVSDVLFRFRLVRTGTVTVDTVRVNFTTTFGVSNGDISSGELWVDVNNDSVIDGGDSSIQSGVGPTGGVLTFDTDFIPAMGGTNFLVRATVNNLSGNDRTTFTLGTSDIDVVQVAVSEYGSTTPAHHAQGTSENYRSIGTRFDYGTFGPEGSGTTVSVANGSMVVTGSGTQWTSYNRGRGDRITIDGTDYTVLSVDSQTQLRLTSAFVGTTVSGLNYTISRKFTTLQAWEACLTDFTTPCEGVASASLVADGRFEVGIAYKDSVFTAGVTIDGATTDATHNITLTVDPGNRHSGVAGGGVILDGQDTDQGIRVQDNYTVLEWFELKRIRGGVSAASVVVQDASSLLLQNLLIHDFDDLSNFVNGIRAQNNVGYTVRNCIIYDGDSAGIRNNEATGTGIVQNCTLYSSQRGVLVSAGTMTVTNTIAVGNTTDFEGSMTGSHNMSTDLTAFNLFGNDPNAITGATSANEFIDDTIPTADLHLATGAQAIDAATDLSGTFTTDIDGATRLGLWDIGADEAGSCACELLQTTKDTNTVTVTVPSSFEMTFDTFAGGGIRKFYDLAEDPGREDDLAGSDDTGNSPHSLHSFGMRFGGNYYNAGNNDSSTGLDLLEATSTRVRVRQKTPLKSGATGLILAGVEAQGDYSIYPSGRLALRWIRETTRSWTYEREYHEMMLHEVPADAFEVSSQTDDTNPNLWDDDFMLAKRDGPDVFTDFLYIQYKDWAAPPFAAQADLDGWTHNPGEERVNPTWVENTGLLLAAGDLETWDTLTYFKPTNLGDAVSPWLDTAVVERSANYRGPDALSVSVGYSWEDAAENTAAGDFFNEAEDAYLARMNTASGLTFDINGAATTRYQPFFKIVHWRSLQDPSVTLEGTSLTNGSDFNADVKPVARAHFAQDLTWHSTLESSGAVTTPDVGTAGAGTVANGDDFPTARYGNGARFEVDGEYISFPPAGSFDSAEGSIEFWYKPFYDYGDELGDPLDDYAFFGYWIDANNYFYAFHEPCDILGGCLGTDEGVQFGIMSGGVLYFAVAGAPPAVPMYWQADEWVHLRFAWKSDGVGTSERIEIFLNGQNIVMSSAGTYDAPVPLDTVFYIGERYKDGLLINNARGIIDEFRIYSTADAPAALAHGGLTSDASEYLANTFNNYTFDFATVDGGRRGEYLYFGSDSKFKGLNIQLAVAGEYTVAPDLLWQYWNGATGAWASLEAVTDFTDETASFTELGGTLFWTGDPDNWSPYSVNGGPDLYTIRAYLVSGDYATTAPVERQIKTDVLLFQYCGDIVADLQTFNFALPPPTAVELVSFEAQGLDQKVELTWETGSEIDNLGFHLYRAESSGGPYERITSALIPGLGSSPVGRQYSYTDSGLSNGVTYYYKLEDIETTGKTEMHGPVWATPHVAEDSSSEESPSEEETETPANASDAVGHPENNRLNVLSEKSDELVLELLTEGFYAIPQEDGTVRLEVPDFVLTDEEGLPALPVKRTWVQALAGRKAEIASVEVSEEEVFEDLRPEASGVPVVEASARGTVELRRGSRRQAAASEEELGQPMTGGFYPGEWARVVETAYQQEVKKALVELAPLRWDEAGQQLVLAHRLVVRVVFRGEDEAETRSRLRTRRQRQSANRVQQNVAARLVTEEAGLYGVSFEQVIRRRRPAAVRAESLRLSRQGQTVPFYLQPNPDVFGPGTKLYFVSEGAESNRYGFEAVYELEVGTGGEQMERGEALPGGEPIPYYWEVVSREENHLYQAALVRAPDRWLWSALFAPVTKSYPYEVSGLSPKAETVKVSVWLQGTTDYPEDPDHHVRLWVKGQVVGEGSWNGKEPKRVDVEFGADLLENGENLLELENVGDTGARYSMVMLNRFEVSYPRRLEAVEGLLAGDWSLSGTAEVSGLSPQTIVLEKRSDKNHIWLTGAEATESGIKFRAEGDRSYLAVSPEAVERPEVRWPLKSALKQTDHRADYLMIGPLEFIEAAVLLVEHREGQGLELKAVSVEEVYSEFGFGEENPGAIRDFLSYAYHQWEKAPRYVLLLGDATFDFKDYLGSGVLNQVPPMMVATSYLETASDPTYAAVNGEDLLPDLAIGRLPASTVEELGVMIAKIVSWEMSGGSLGGRAVLVADNPDGAGDFTANAEELAETVLSSLELEKIYLSELGTASTRSKILQAFDEGSSLMSYIGHGGIDLWASENIFNTDDVQLLSHQTEQPLLLTMNCLNGYFHFPFINALAEEVLKAEGKGIVAAFSPSGLSVNSAAHIFHRLLLEELMNGGHTRLGDAVLAAQSAYVDSGALPEMIAIYHLFGDPAMKLQ